MANYLNCMKFFGLNKIKAITVSANVIGGLCVLLVIWLPNGWWTAVLAFSGLFTVISGQIVLLLAWKCPHCDRHLPINGMFGMDFCPYCGNRLE